jgi:hypothetical protein
LLILSQIHLEGNIIILFLLKHRDQPSISIYNIISINIHPFLPEGKMEKL